MRTPHPYRQIKLSTNRILRAFDSDVNPDELIWHQDQSDRKIYVVECDGWKIQLEKGLPIDLREGQEYVVPARSWHRVIKGSGQLVVEIVES